MKLYNSLSGDLEDFRPIDEKNVKVYSCGPTVYNNLHIGNLSAFIYADILKRTLRCAGYEVQHVMNITDVDDKTIRDSRRDYPNDDPKTALKKLTDKYTKVFLEDLQATGNDVDSIEFISAVDTIPEMVKLIQKIINAGFGYVADDGIYFSIADYTKAGHDYGLLQKVEIKTAQSRVNNDEYDKESASDFALWKAAEPGEPSWDALFNIDGKNVNMPGRPGWHIECSAMSEKLLGVPFDIHTGGIDLKFPHHENEIAQTCGAGASKLANYFVHNNHILVDGRKMSKSLGNFYTLRDIEDRGYTAQDFRILVIESRYRNESNFSWESLDSAHSRINGWRQAFDTRWQIEPTSSDDVKAQEKIKKYHLEIIELAKDDLNTPQILAVIGYVCNLIENRGLSSDLLPLINQIIVTVRDLLGIEISGKDIEQNQKETLRNRQKARDRKDWAESDRLRDELASQGVGIKDGPSGQIWYRL